MCKLSETVPKSSHSLFQIVLKCYQASRYLDRSLLRNFVNTPTQAHIISVSVYSGESNSLRFTWSTKLNSARQVCSAMYTILSLPF